MDYVIFRDIAVVLIAGKYMGLLARRWKAPQVAGEILAGLLIGPCLLGLVQPSDFLTQMAELGVVLLMFSAGLDSGRDHQKRPYRPAGGYVWGTAAPCGRYSSVHHLLWI